MAISQEIRLADVPALGLALAGFSGAALALFAGHSPWLNLYVIATAGAVALLFLFFAANRKVAMFSVLVALALLVGLRGSGQIARDERTAFIHIADDSTQIDCRGTVAWIESGHRSSALVNVWLEDVRLTRSADTAELSRLRVRLAVPLRETIGIAIGDVVACRIRFAENSGFPGSLQELAWTLEHRLAGRAKLADTASLVVVHGGNSLRRMVYEVRASLLAGLERHLKPDARAVAGALLLGERSSFSPEFKSELQITGLAHLFALSGLNTGLLVSLCWLGMSWVRIPRQLRYVLLLLLLTIYAALGLGAPSLIRSSIMAGMIIIGRLLHRKAHPINLLLLAAGIELAIWPLHLLDLGFHLSYLSLAGILAAYSALKQPLQDLLRTPSRSFRSHLVEILASTMGAQIATAPVVALSFGRVSGLAILANLIAIPLFSILLVLVVVLLMLDPVSSGLAAVCGRSIEGLVALFAQLTSAASDVVGASIRAPLIWYAAATVMIIVLAAIVAALRGRQLIAVLFLLAGLNIAVWHPLGQDIPVAECVALESSETSSVFARVGAMCAVIGCGSDNRQERAASALQRELERSGLNNSDFLLLPSLSAAEIGGAPSLIRTARPTVAIRFSEFRQTQAVALMEAACLENGVTFTPAVPGTRWQSGPHHATLARCDRDGGRTDWDFLMELPGECSVVITNSDFSSDSTFSQKADGSVLYILQSGSGFRGSRWVFEEMKWQQVESSGRRAARWLSIPIQESQA